MSELQAVEPTPSPAPPPAPPQLGPDALTTPAPEPSPGAAPSKPNIAAGVPSPEPEPEKPYWQPDWREKMAEHAAAGDKKAYDKELRRLQSFENPLAVYGSFRSMENTWASKNFVKLPPKENASEADLKEFHKALGVPEAPEKYFDHVQLENGAVIGEADKPLVDGFAAIAHKAGMPPQAFNAALNWYFQNQQQQADALDEADDKFRVEAEKALKDEFGKSFKRRINSISSLFAAAPGGADTKNPQALISRLLGGRTADGRVIGDDPDVNKFLMQLAQELNPSFTVVEDGDPGGKSVEAEIAEIEKIMREDRRRYDRDYAGRYAELLSARDKIQARSRA